VIGHVEVPHTRRGHEHAFDIPSPAGDPDHLAALARAGFHVATLGGNHVFDHGTVMVAATAAALEDRRRTGFGRHIDAAMVEIGVQQMADALVLAQLGRPLRRMGNRCRKVLLQGVYRTRGHDRFIAISAFDAGDCGKSAC
jgi:crotonobetainyl-CoA:carnitine CoA-transferase CaiB-like acyl-CoA transferase